MTNEEKDIALYCLKANSGYHSEVCEECVRYPNCDHTMQDDIIESIIKTLEQQPCEDCISRQAVHDLIAELLSDYLHDKDREKIEELDVKIEDLEPVTPKEKTGVWVPTDEEPHEDYECNICGYVVSTFTANIEPHTEYKYCPNCGARMVSE